MDRIKTGVIFAHENEHWNKLVKCYSASKSISLLDHHISLCKSVGCDCVCIVGGKPITQLLDQCAYQCDRLPCFSPEDSPCIMFDSSLYAASLPKITGCSAIICGQSENPPVDAALVSTSVDECGDCYLESMTLDESRHKVEGLSYFKGVSYFEGETLQAYHKLYAARPSWLFTEIYNQLVEDGLMVKVSYPALTVNHCFTRYQAGKLSAITSKSDDGRNGISLPKLNPVPELET